MRTILICFFLLTAIGANAQQVYKGQMTVVKKNFNLSGDRLYVELGIDYEGIRLPANESLTLTPIIKTKRQTLTLPPILINGPKREKAYHRAEVLYARHDSIELNTTPAMVIENNEKRVRQFTYNASVPYSNWMAEASLFIRTEECDCNDRAAETFEDKVADALYGIQLIKVDIEQDVDPFYLSAVNFLDPASEEETIHYLRGNIPFSMYNRWDKLSEDKQNYEIYFRLRDAIGMIEKEVGTKLVNVQLTGYGAPAGNLKKNEHGAAMRALSLKDYLRENGVAGKTPIEVSWIAEDWDSISTLVKNSEMMLREAVLDIIRTIDVSKGRERVLVELADGVPYRYLTNRIFPQVRRVDYEIIYTCRKLNLSSSHVVSRNAQTLRQVDLFVTAKGYLEGSTEFNDVIDLTARLFPESPTANINAAAVALSKKDVVRARRYLEKFSTNPAAYNNLGVLYLLEGNRDKAEVYLEMSSAIGVQQAQETLRKIK